MRIDATFLKGDDGDLNGNGQITLADLDLAYVAKLGMEELSSRALWADRYTQRSWTITT